MAFKSPKAEVRRSIGADFGGVIDMKESVIWPKVTVMEMERCE